MPMLRPEAEAEAEAEAQSRGKEPDKRSAGAQVAVKLARAAWY
jgi:hypothetical protein